MLPNNRQSIDCLEIIRHFYPEDTPLRRLLLKHSVQVRDKALELQRHCNVSMDIQLISDGAMLHDIGIGRCHAPGILCHGTEDYMAHGVIGARMLREYGKAQGLDLEAFARICERHTGTGLTAQEVQAEHLPIPVQDYMPLTQEERLVCLADKFFSKSGDMAEKALPRIRAGLAKFGEAPARRLDDLCREFGLL